MKECKSCRRKGNEIRDLMDKKISLYNKKELYKGLLVFALIIAFGLLLMFIGKGHNIDESKFCLDKLNKYFPEYGFERAAYNSEDVCTGYYSEEKEIRDGLQVYDNTEKTKDFKLLKVSEINYLAQDDWFVFSFWSGIVLSLGAIGISIFWGLDWCEKL